MERQFIPLTSITRAAIIDQSTSTELDPTLEQFNTPRAKEMAEYLNARGLMNGAGTIQGDVAVANYLDPKNPGFGSDKPLCQMNCDIQGGYICGARRKANPKINVHNLAPTDKIAKGFLVSAKGLKEFNKLFVIDGSLDTYCKEFKISDEVKEGIAYNLLFGKVNANIFGGDPEIHPGVFDIAKICKEAGFHVTLTTTTDIALTDSKLGKNFLDGLSRGYIDTLAVSGEFKDIEHIQKLADLGRDGLKQEHNQIPFDLGQLRKGLAAVNAARLFEEHFDDPDSQFPKELIFNVVITPKILKDFEKRLTLMKNYFPHVKINPYPAQSSQYFGPSVFSPEDIPLFQSFIQNRLEEQRTQDPHMVQRPHYYAMLSSVLETFADDPETTAKMLSGYDTWKCYETSGAGAVFQFGASPELRNLEEQSNGGLIPNCFWNETTIFRRGRQVWRLQPKTIAKHIVSGMQKIAKEAACPCPGCIMPRLTGSMLTLGLGLHKALKANYISTLKSLISNVL